MKWTIRIIEGLLGLAFLAVGCMKLLTDPEMMKTYSEPFGYSTGFMYGVGVAEALAGLLLIAGFWKSGLAIVGSGLITIVMLGATYTNFKAGQAGFALQTIVLLVLALIVGFGLRSMERNAANPGTTIS